MGALKLNDGSIERADLDGQNRKTIVPEGATFTPKQLHLDRENGKLYWSDREGMRVMRVNLDGSHIETLVDTSQGDARPGRDATKWCVGITADPKRGSNLLDSKGSGQRQPRKTLSREYRHPERRERHQSGDIEVLFDHLPEPIDLELDVEHRVLYWTDRGDPPRGNTVNRASVDSKPETPQIVFSHLMEGIGIALDVAGNRMFMTDFAGSVYSANLDGSEKKELSIRSGQPDRNCIRRNTFKGELIMST